MMMGIVVVRGGRPRFPRQKKSAGLKEKERLKSESAECERKKCEFTPFFPLPRYTGNPVPEPKTRGKSKGLE
jgi:hypothetical protein